MAIAQAIVLREKTSNLNSMVTLISLSLNGLPSTSMDNSKTQPISTVNLTDSQNLVLHHAVKSLLGFQVRSGVANQIWVWAVSRTI